MWRGEGSVGIVGLLAALVLAVAACSEPLAGDSTVTSTSLPTMEAPETTEVSDDPDGTSTTEPADTTVASATPSSTTSNSASCDIPDGEPFHRSDAVELTDLGEVDGVGIRAAVYPHPDYEGRPWSQWGQGIVASNGKYFSAIGDHQSEDGNSFVYEYDPDSNTLTMVGDVLSYVDHVEGTWGYGKIHSQMVPGPCGEIYFSTYWGSFRNIEFEGNYTGDILFRLDPFGETLQPLGVPVEFHGQPSMASAPEYSLIYAEAADPVFRNEDGGDRGPFFAYDVTKGEVVYLGPDEPRVGFRSILVDADGVAYYSIGGGELQTYDPSSGDSSTHESRLPGDWLRAATLPAPDGSVYGVTRDPDRFFVMRPDGSIDELGDALGYTTSMALSPDGSTFYYMPGAHGNSADWNSPLVAVDTSTGDQTIVAELYDIVEENLGYRVGGTYNVAISPDGGTVFMGVNVGELGTDESFGEVVLLVLELPR